MKIKVKDIAKAAGVSPTTVSLVLNNRPSRIAEDTKEHIFRIAREMQFQKETEINFTEFKKVRTIGMMIPAGSNAFYHSLGEEAAKCALLCGYTVFQCYTGDEIDGFYSALEGVMAKNVDGLIVIPPASMNKENAKMLKSVQKSGVPLVLLDRAAYNVFCDFVTADNKHGGRIATEYMIKHGHKKIGMITAESNIYTSRKRLEGYREALASSKISFDKELIFYGDCSMETGRLGAGSLIGRGVTAIVAGNDQIACGVYLYAREHGLTVPEDISVIGYDNQELCGVLQAPLTSVDQNAKTMASKAVEVLLRQIDGEEEEAPPRNYYFTPYIAERGSVKAITG